MDWSAIFHGILTVVIWFFIMMFIVSIIHDLGVSDWRRRMVEWLESRVRDLEWERNDLKSDLRWIKIDLDHQKSRAAYAEERNDRLSRELDSLYKLLAKKETGEGGAPMQASA